MDREKTACQRGTDISFHVQKGTEASGRRKPLSSKLLFSTPALQFSSCLPERLHPTLIPRISQAAFLFSRVDEISPSQNSSLDFKTRLFQPAPRNQAAVCGPSCGFICWLPGEISREDCKWPSHDPGAFGQLLSGWAGWQGPDRNHVTESAATAVSSGTDRSTLVNLNRDRANGCSVRITCNFFS